MHRLSTSHDQWSDLHEAANEHSLPWESRDGFLADILTEVSDVVSPVWPLADSVAVNPYEGLRELGFVDAHRQLQQYSNCQLLMPMQYYMQELNEGRLDWSDVRLACDELKEDGLADGELVSVSSLSKLMQASRSSLQEKSFPASPPSLESVSRQHDQCFASQWTQAIHESIGSHLSAYYDQDQAMWRYPWRDASLLDAWRSAMKHDRKLELQGLRGLRSVTAGISSDPQLAIAQALHRMGVPSAKWKTYLLSLVYELPGWSAWTKFKSADAASPVENGSDFIAFVAIRAVYDMALAEAAFRESGWKAKYVPHPYSFPTVSPSPDNAPERHALLRAQEISVRNSLLRTIGAAIQGDNALGAPAQGVSRKLAQLVFCIDVRSERVRVEIEKLSPRVETFGFAGFFGLAFSYERLGSGASTSQLPVLLRPAFHVHEQSCDSVAVQSSSIDRKRRLRAGLQAALKRFQKSPLSTFSYVESTGLGYGFKLLARLGASVAGPLRRKPQDGLGARNQRVTRPEFVEVGPHALPLERKVELAENLLRNLGLLKDFARLVVFCGHASHTENNPLQATLDCGACGGHSGEPNARLAATLLNNQEVRRELGNRGIMIPADVHFVAALHHTTTDQIEFFDCQATPASHVADLDELSRLTQKACLNTHAQQPGNMDSRELHRRSTDWSEVRPEWGLAGNAAFVIGPRSVTRSMPLKGRAFLHSYDHHLDPEGRTLETIMTAPLIVAHWINMQYYASAVDEPHFGSGNKTIHNVVGGFGLFAGNGGDLRIGLPTESLHDGRRFQHQPLRLTAIICAPREAIQKVLDAHAVLRDRIVNGWLHLVAHESGQSYRFSPLQRWEPLEAEHQPRVREIRPDAVPIAINHMRELSARFSC